MTAEALKQKALDGDYVFLDADSYVLEADKKLGEMFTPIAILQLKKEWLEKWREELMPNDILTIEEELIRESKLLLHNSRPTRQQ